MKLTFYGGVEEVTGANYLLESQGGTRVLIDCGLNQGKSIAEKKNWQKFSYDPASIDAVFITHSHIDHIGLLPKLYKEGFRGVVYSTPPCKDFSRFLLLDSQHVLGLEAEHSGKDLIYEEKHIEGIMKLWESREYHDSIVVDDLTFVLYNAGHILGSSFIVAQDLSKEGVIKKIAFSGDLGNSPAPIIGDKDSLPKVDYCLIESTYGDRVHETKRESQIILEDVIRETCRNKGVLMIPAFAMERTQQLLFNIHQLVEHGTLPLVAVYLDSPLAIHLTAVYKNYSRYYKDSLIFNDRHDSVFEFKGLKKTITTRQSKTINNTPSPKIIIAGSGMMHAGRILHHLKRYLPDRLSVLLIVGYQAEGSLGRKIYDGAKKVKIHGEMISVRARVKAVGGLSAHADQPQLMRWLRPRKNTLQRVFVIQGERGPSSVMRDMIIKELGVDALIPESQKTYLL